MERTGGSNRERITRPVRRLAGAILLLICAAGSGRAGGQESTLSWPTGLTDKEVTTLQRASAPRAHVEAVLKISALRMEAALSLARQNRYPEAQEQLALFISLVEYADRHTRALPPTRRKDRDHNLKRLEQAIFRQNNPLDTLLAELPYQLREESQPAVNTVRRIRLQAINDLLGGGRAITPPEE